MKMPVDAIGAPLSQAVSPTQNSGLSQEDFIKLFLAQLNFQDPLKPLDNREFLAQMAQFANLQQSKTMSDDLKNLVFMNSTAQSIGLLGREVEVAGDNGAVTGTVKTISFSQSGPQLSVTTSDNNVLTGIKLSQVHLVRF
jgi:flagellar basal-body rod modification protein FlgD